MKLYGQDLDRAQALRRVGGLQQLGGVQVMSFEEGHARGVRVAEFRTGTGLRFQVAIDRGMDVAACDYRGASLGWHPPKGFVAPQYLEGGDTGWLRVSGLGGLFNTCGLVTIGNQQRLDTSHYQYMARQDDFYGIHDRIGITPASRFACGEEWDGDRCVLWAEGDVHEEIEYGEHLSLRRRYETELGSDTVRIRDRVTNEGFYETPHQLLYHFNVGFPVLDDGAELLVALNGPAPENMFSGGPPDPERYRRFTGPQAGFQSEGYDVPVAPDGDGWGAAAVVNRGFDGGRGIGVSLRYDTRTLPVYVEWRMMGEGLYAVGMEPATNGFASVPELVAQGAPVMLAPGETRTYDLEFGVLADNAAIDRFAARLPAPDQET